MARRQGHAARLYIFLGRQALIGQILNVPGVEKNASTLRTIPEALEHVVNLINLATVSGWPLNPLSTVERTQITRVSRPFVPNRNPIFTQPLGVGVATQKPNQLINDTFKVHLLRR